MGDREQTYDIAWAILEEKILNDSELSSIKSHLLALMQASEDVARRFDEFHKIGRPLELRWSEFQKNVFSPEISHLAKYIFSLTLKSWDEATEKGVSENNIERKTPIPDKFIEFFEEGK